MNYWRAAQDFHANPNAQETTSGYTALMLAAMKGHAKIVALLLDHGAVVNARDKTGNTALTFARLESRRGVQWKDIDVRGEACALVDRSG